MRSSGPASKPTPSSSARAVIVPTRSTQDQPAAGIDPAAVRQGSNVVPFPGPALDPRIVRAIGEALRASYDNLLRQPVPDRFVALLDQLRVRDAEERP